MSGHGADRRPWLILSRREAEALVEALSYVPMLTPAMISAGAQLQLQLAYIAGARFKVDPSSVEAAIEREYQRL